MKRALLWLLAALALGTIAGQLILDDPGYLFVAWHEYVVETSLWVAITGVAVLFLALLLAMGLLGALVDAAATLRRWRGEQRARKARELTDQGLARYAAAEWRKATSTLLKAAELVDTPLLVRLAAARAAEEDGRIDLARQVLREARTSAGAAVPLVDVQLAALKLRHDDAPGARLILELLREKFPQHPRVLVLLADTYVALGAWEPLTLVLPTLKKLLPPTTWEALARRAWIGHITAVGGGAGYASRKSRIDALRGAWKSASGDFHSDEQIVVTLVDLLVKYEESDEAQATIERTLNNASPDNWSDVLIARYGRLDVEKPAEQLATIEKWLTMRPTHAALLLAAGRSSLRNKLWGKARDYFEASAARQATPEGCAELVRLYTRLGESAKAEQFLRKQAELTGNELPKLPLPTARM